jgi:hypothetical protein
MLRYEQLEKESYHIQVLLKDMLELERMERNPLMALESTLSFADRPGLKLSDRVPKTTVMTSLELAKSTERMKRRI